jgi:hypothetical protein
MRVMLMDFPRAERLVQVRLFDRTGNVVTVEGPITRAEYDAIFITATGTGNPSRRGT